MRDWSSDVCSTDLITGLDFALRLTPADAPMPYLAPEMGVLPHGCVGLCHGAGSWDAARSIPPHLLAPICAMAPCISLMPEPTTLPVLNPDGRPFAMQATSTEDRWAGKEWVSPCR